MDDAGTSPSAETLTAGRGGGQKTNWRTCSSTSGETLWVEPGRGGRRRKRRVQDPPFGTFVAQLLDERREELSEGTLRHHGWCLAHLSRYFFDWRLREIDAEAVDEYRTEKVRESKARGRAIEAGRPEHDDGGRVMRPLTPNSINRTIDTLQWVLTAALDYGLIEANPAQGKRRRLRCEARPPVFLDSAAQVEALIAAAESLDRSPESRISDRLAMIGTLIFAGLRSGELGALLRPDVDLSEGRILIRQAKTAAGRREVTVSPILSSLLKRKPGLDPCRSPQELVFATRTGRPRDKDNIRGRTLLPAVARAQAARAGRPTAAIPGVSPHKLRHTFASILIACGARALRSRRKCRWSLPLAIEVSCRAKVAPRRASTELTVVAPPA